jgi:serine/threonine protein kinase
MSSVFLAEENALGRKVVIKVLPPDLLASISVDRFKREIQLAAKLQQAQIVPVLTTGEVGGIPYYTMPFVAGESLRAKLARTGALPIPEVVGILRDVTRALAYAHEYGVVHRDIKPDNVLLSGGTAVVTDFGIAKAISAARETTPDSALTQMGTSIGTPAYISPEQAAGDPNVDHRADIYSFGCLAYELLAGHPPLTVARRNERWSRISPKRPSRSNPFTRRLHWRRSSPNASKGSRGSTAERVGDLRFAGSGDQGDPAAMPAMLLSDRAPAVRSWPMRACSSPSR